jgi:alkanesulfonate monooxygenase SsuD/methylene tetrahydromethanopterin reductase-like flavin-dependent oxidoreductase (luciferase family)
VRVYEDFAQVDLLSGGRAEIIVGGGGFIESFALFGYSPRTDSGPQQQRSVLDWYLEVG